MFICVASIVGPGMHLWSQICQDIRWINAISITCKFNTKGCQGKIPPQLAIALQRQHIPLKQDVYHLDSSSPSFWQGVPGSIHFAPPKKTMSAKPCRSPYVLFRIMDLQGDGKCLKVDVFDHPHPTKLEITHTSQKGTADLFMENYLGCFVCNGKFWWIFWNWFGVDTFWSSPRVWRLALEDVSDLFLYWMLLNRY